MASYSVVHLSANEDVPNVEILKVTTHREDAYNHAINTFMESVNITDDKELLEEFKSITDKEGSKEGIFKTLLEQETKVFFKSSIRVLANVPTDDYILAKKYKITQYNGDDNETVEEITFQHLGKHIIANSEHMFFSAGEKRNRIIVNGERVDSPIEEIKLSRNDASLIYDKIITESKAVGALSKYIKIEFERI